MKWKKIPERVFACVLAMTLMVSSIGMPAYAAPHTENKKSVTQTQETKKISPVLYKLISAGLNLGINVILEPEEEVYIEFETIFTWIETALENASLDAGSLRIRDVRYKNKNIYLDVYGMVKSGDDTLEDVIRMVFGPQKKEGTWGLRSIDDDLGIFSALNVLMDGEIIKSEVPSSGSKTEDLTEDDEDIIESIF